MKQFPTDRPDRSKRQATGASRSRRPRRMIGIVAGGAVVATSAIAIPVLAQTVDQPSAEAGPTTTSAAIDAALSTTTTVAPLVRTPAAPTRDLTRVETADPAAAFAAQFSTMTPDEQAAFKLFTMSGEERAAFTASVTPAPESAPAPEPAPAPAPPPAPAPAPAAPTSGGAPGGFLGCVRQRESRGNYRVNTGNGYYGAYQFSMSTWNNTARHAGRGDLVGVAPSNASPADQDAMAVSLYQWQGRSPWAGPGC